MEFLVFTSERLLLLDSFFVEMLELLELGKSRTSLTLSRFQLDVELVNANLDG